MTDLPPELNRALESFFEASQPDAAFVDRLERQLRLHGSGLTDNRKASQLAPTSKRLSYMYILRTRPVLALFFALLALLLLSGIAYAVGRLFGFIPGIGFVDDVQSMQATPVSITRPLVNTSAVTPLTIEGESAPQTKSEQPTPEGHSTAQKREGVTVTIQQVIAERERLVIAYEITGLPMTQFSPERAATITALESEIDPYLVNIRLADGSTLDLMNGSHCNGGGDGNTSWLSCRLVRSPLPEGVNQFTFEIQRLPNSLPGELPENWVIPVSLVPVSPADGINLTQELNLRSQPVNGITLMLIKAVQTPFQAAFQLGMAWEAPNRFVHHTAPITLRDAQGRYFILTGGPDGGTYAIDNPNSMTLPSQVTFPINGGGPLTFRIDWVIMSISGAAPNDPAGAPILRVDAGNDPVVGQEWPIDQRIQAGGFDLHFIQARLKPGQDGGIILEIDAEPQPGITSLNLMPVEGSASIEAGFDSARRVLVSRISLPALPENPIDLYISEILSRIDGPWEISWQPESMPVSSLKPTPAPIRMAPAEPDLLPGQPLLDEIKDLLSGAFTPSGPGWVHQHYWVTYQQPAAMLDTADLPEQPAVYSVDAWYMLDENGYIRTTIYLRKTPDGRLVGADIDSGLYHFSLPEGRGGVGQDIYLARPAYDLNQLSQFNNIAASGGPLQREESEVDGIACHLYSGTMPYNPPMVLSGELLPVGAMVHTACIDPLTGAVLQIQNQVIYTDGTSRDTDSTRFVSVESVDVLPEDVRSILDLVIIPE